MFKPVCSFLIAAFAVAGAQATAQSGRAVRVDQIGTARPAASTPGAEQVTVPAVRTRRGATSSAGTGNSEELQPARTAAAAPHQIEACRNAQITGVRVEGLNCTAIMRQETPAAAGGEGTLLELFGQAGSLSGLSPDAAPVEAVDADAVARQLATGNAQDGTAAGAVVQDRAPPQPQPAGPR